MKYICALIVRQWFNKIWTANNIYLVCFYLILNSILHSIYIYQVALTFIIDVISGGLTLGAFLTFIFVYSPNIKECVVVVIIHPTHHTHTHKHY